MPAAGELDYGELLASSFDSRAFAQTLLNGQPVTRATADTPAEPLDARSLQALRQLGLPHNQGRTDVSGAESIHGTPKAGQGPWHDALSGVSDVNGIANDAFASTFAKAGAGDVSAALAKLSVAVDGLNKQLRSEINTHHAALLAQAGSVAVLEDNLSQVRGGLTEVEGSVDRLRRKIAVPYETLSNDLGKLAKLQRASDLARRAHRFVTLARRLDVQMAELNEANTRLLFPDPVHGKQNPSLNGDNALLAPSSALERTVSREMRDKVNNDTAERALSEAALTLAELDQLMQSSNTASEVQETQVSIRSIVAVEQHVSSIQANRKRVIGEMEVMIRRGLQDLNQPLLASSLQTAHNLAVLPALVKSLVQDLIDAIESRIKSAFDVTALARDAAIQAGEPLPATNGSTSVFYKSRARTEPTSANLHHFQSALWHRLECLIEDMAGCCIKVHVLERVLKMKRDPISQATFLDEVLTTLDNKPTFTFWTTLSQCFEAQSREAARNSTFIQQTLTIHYPRLLRLFHEFFSKIALQADISYGQSSQSPETVLILRSINLFETSYLARASNRMTEAVSAAFAHGQRSPPGMQEGTGIARVLSNELDAARFDPLLIKGLTKYIGKAIDSFVDRAETLIASDYTAVSMVGPQATQSQLVNAELATSLYHLWSLISRVIVGYPASIQEALSAQIQAVHTSLLDILNPLFAAARREVAAIINRIHKCGFDKPNDQTSPSVFMQDLSEKLSFIRRHLLAQLRVGELTKEWTIDVSKFILQRFVSHASIVHPLGEAGKLKLTTDCTTLEFALSQLLGDFKVSLSMLGQDYKALRAFRPLLFLDKSALAQEERTHDVPALVLLHHILVRTNSLPLPHELLGWQEGEYIRFIAEHTDHENRKFIDKVILDWEDRHKPVTVAGGEAELQEYIDIAKAVMKREEDLERHGNDTEA